MVIIDLISRELNAVMRQFVSVVLLSVALTQTGFAGTAFLVGLMTLDEAVRSIMQEGRNKVLAARTDKIDGRRVHIIKILTPEGRIQHIKIDAQSGRPVR